METVVGIFRSSAQAEAALSDLLKSGVPQSSIVYFTGAAASPEIQNIRTTDAESPGMGKTIGAYLGAVTGAGAGLSIGSAVASLMIPGVGPIMAVGLGAAALLGVGGAAAGAKVGDASEMAMDEGIPKDDVFFYRDLLKRGASLLLVNLDPVDNTKMKHIRSLLDHNGAEDVDVARRQWKEHPPQDLRRAS